MRQAVFILCAVLSLAGCKSQCRQLSERLCDCSANTSDKDACLRRASSAESSNPPTEVDEVTCKNLLDAKACDCRLIDTTEGKIRCGLARPLDGGL